MIKRALTLLVALCTGAAFATTDFDAVKAIVGRLAGGYDGANSIAKDAEKGAAAMNQFVFAKDPSIAAGAGKVEAADGKIQISASDASGASFALGQYMRHTAKIHISWCGNRTIETYPLPTETVTYTPTIPVRFAYNYCTLSYTMAFWSEKEWREEIDRLALSGYNVALVLQGLQEAWRVTLESIKDANGARVYSDEQIMKYVSDEAAQAWWHMGNLEGLGGPLGGEKGDYSAPDAYAKFTARCQKDAALGEFIYREMIKLGIQPSIQSFVGLVPDCSNQVLANGVDETGARFDSLPNWGIINEGGWQGYTRPDVVNPLNKAFDVMSEAWYGALVDIYKPSVNGGTHYMGGDLFHEGGNKGSLTDADLANIAKKIQQTQNDYFGNGDPDAVTWILQSWQGSPYQGIRNGLDCKKAIIQLLDKDMSTTGGVGANYWNNTTGEHIPWIWVEVLNFGGNTGMHGGARRFRNLSKIGTASGHEASFKGYGILSEGLETNPMMYDMFNDAFTREVGQSSSIDDTKMKTWIRDYCERRYGMTDANLESAYAVLIGTVFDCSRYQEGCVENMLCAGPTENVINVSKWGPKAGIEYDPAELYPAAYSFLDAAKAHPELLELETFQYDFVELFLQLLGERGRVINAEIATPGAKRNLFLKMFDLAERLTASSDRWRLDWHEARTMTVCPDKAGVRGYRRMVTCWADGYSAGQATGLREYAHRAYAGLLKDYYLKRWQYWFDLKDGKITSSQYTTALSNLDETFMTAELEATPKGDLLKLGEEILETLNPPALTLDATGQFVDWTSSTWTDAKGASTEWIDDYDVNLSGVCTITATKPVNVGSLTTGPSSVSDVAEYTGYLPVGAEKAVKLFSNMASEDRARVAYFRGTMNGGWVAQGEAKSYQVNDGPQYCEMQMQRLDDGYLKSVRVRTYFNPADNGIWGYAVNAGNIHGGSLGANVTGTGTSVATSDSANGYGIKDFAAVLNSEIRMVGPITVSGTLTVEGGLVTLTTSEQASAPGEIVVRNGTLILDGITEATLHNLNIGAGGKIVIKGGDTFTHRIKVIGTAPAKGAIVYQVGNDELALAVGSDGFLKTTLGTMTYAGLIGSGNDAVTLGWKYVTLEDLYNCVYTAGDGTTSTDLMKGEDEVVFTIGSNGAQVTLTIEDGVVHASSYPGITNLTADPAVARVAGEKREISGDGSAKVLTFTGELQWNGGAQPIGWTGVTPEELKDYTFSVGNATGNKATMQYYYGSLNVDIGGTWFTFSTEKSGEINLMVSKNFNGTLTATPPGAGTVAMSGVTNFLKIEDAVAAATQGEEITVIADTELTESVSTDLNLTILPGVTLKAVGKLPWNQSKLTLNVYGTIDFGSTYKEFGYEPAKKHEHALNLYAGGKVKSGDIVSFYTDFSIAVKAAEGADTATFASTFRSCKNTTINIDKGVTLVIEGDIIPRENSANVGYADPYVIKTGEGTLQLNGVLKEGVDAMPHLEVRAGTLARALEQEEIFSAKMTGGTADITSADEDYEVIEPADPVGNVHTWKSQGILWLFFVTDPGETAQNGPGKKFKTFKEAYAYALDLRRTHSGQTVKLWGMVANESQVKAALEAEGAECGLTLDWTIAPAGMEIIGWDEEVRYYYTAAEGEWKNTTVVTKKQGGSSEDYTVQPGDIVIFDKNNAGSHTLKDGNTFGVIYIHGHETDASKVVCTEIEIAKDTNVEVGFEGGHYSIPPEWTVNLNEGAALTFRNWGSGKGSVIVPDAHFNGKGTVTFHGEITSGVNVSFGKITGDAVIDIPAAVTIHQDDAQSYIENSLAGSGKVIVKNVDFAYTLAEDSEVTFEVDSSVEGEWTEVRAGNIVTFASAVRRVWTDEDAIFVGITLDEITTGKYTLGGMIGGAWMGSGKTVGTVVYQQTEDGIIAQFQAKDSDSTFTGTKYVNMKLVQSGHKIFGTQVDQGNVRSSTYEGYGDFITTGHINPMDGENATYKMTRIAAGIDYAVDGAESWLALPEDMIPEDTVVLGNFGELTLTSALSFKVKGAGNLITTVEPTAAFKSQLQAATWKGTFTLSGLNNTASVRPINPSNYGNSNSVVEVKDCENAYFNGNGSSDGELKVTGTLTIVDGYGGQTFNLAKLSGSGTINLNKTGLSDTHTIKVADGTDFTGTINKVDNGSISIVFATAKVNGTVYYSIDEAVAAAGESDTIEILRNVEGMVITAAHSTQKIRVPSGFERYGNFALVTEEEGLWYKTADLPGDTTSILSFNPGTDEAFGKTWTNVYLGPTMKDTTSGDWMISTDWATKSGKLLVRNANGRVPYVSGKDGYQSALVDGDNLRHVTTSGDGYKHIAAGNLDGWDLGLGLAHGVLVTVADLSKFQSNTSGLMCLCVDATSKLVIEKMEANGNCNNSIALHVAAADGIVFNGFKAGTEMQYYFEGAGSVSYGVDALAGTHVIKALPAVDLGEGEGKIIASRKLIGCKAGRMSVSLADDCAIAATDGTAMTKGDEVSLDDEVGAYSLRTAEDGIYLDYVARRSAKVVYYKSGYIGNETSLQLTETSGGSAAEYEDVPEWNIVIDSNSPAQAWAAKTYKYAGHDITVSKFIVAKNFTLKNGANQEGIFEGITFEVMENVKLTLADSSSNQKMTLGAAHFAGRGSVDLSGVSNWTMFTTAEGMSVTLAATAKFRTETVDGVTTYVVSTAPTSWADVAADTPLAEFLPAEQVEKLEKHGITAAAIKDWVSMGHAYGVTIDFDPAVGIDLNSFALGTYPAWYEMTKANFKLSFIFDADGKPIPSLPEYFIDNCNIKPVIKGSTDLKEWHDKAEGDKFFKAVIELPGSESAGPQR